MIAFNVDDDEQSVDGTITLDRTAVAVIKIHGVPVRWEFNLNTFTLSVQP